MKYKFSIFYSLISLFSFVPSFCNAQNDYTAFVDPFIGTGGHGHTFPGAVVPFGMVQLSPDTRLEGWDGCSGYHYSDSIIYGFSHTHLSGTGGSDYGDILLMPTLDPLQLQNKDYSSTFKKANEKASPGYYSVLLDKSNITVELTATAHTGLQKYTFPKSGNSNVILDLTHRDKVKNGEINIVGNNEINGVRISSAWAETQMVYFVIQFSKPFRKSGIAKSDIIQDGIKRDTGEFLKAYVQFETKQGEIIYARIGISGVSIDGARKNLEAEQPNFNFEKVEKNAHNLWNRELSKIEIETKDIKAKKIFYTSLYHCFIAPNIYQDVDGKYRGRDLKIHETKDFNYYTVFSLWDTYRALHPLFTLIDRKRTADYINTFITQYKQGGCLPVWELSGWETNCMIGYHAVPVIAEAYLKGIPGFDIQKAFEAMKFSAMEDRNGLKSYKENGYIKFNSEGQNVSRTLEYAYDDWCIAMVAKKLGKEKDYKYFIKRAQNYKNVFDTSTGFMRPRNGDFLSPFDTYSVDNNYTEANAWQYSFYVPQDLDGHIKLLGGKNKLVNFLDSLFAASSKLTGHEQMDISGMIGQYVHGNEPSHQIAYEYDYAGQPWKSQYWVRRIMDELYDNKPDGLAGNEDCGQMSAWYILSSLGFYEVCPGGNQYAIGSPIFDKAVIHFENGKSFTISTTNNSKIYKYIQSATLNNKVYTKSFLTYEDLTKGGTINFDMGAEPNKVWGSGITDMPETKIDN